MVQGAKSGGGVSAPIAQRIMEQCLALERGYDPQFAALPPAAGSFAQIDAVDYRRPVAATAARAIPVGVPVPFDAADDPETMDSIDAPPRAIPVEPSHFRRPDIRPEADPRGRMPLRFPVTPAPARPSILKPFFEPER